jgi:predicted Rossmann fold flavoprotein
VPSLFTFTIPDARLHDLAGLSVQSGEVAIEGTKLRRKGPILITHWGLSGPAVLKLSAWGARDLHARGYQANLRVNWMDMNAEAVGEVLKQKRETLPGNLVAADNHPRIPRRLWVRLALAAGLPERARWAEVSNERLRAFAEELTNGAFKMTGKSPFKDEFVTAGGIPLDEVDFRSMQSKRCPGLYFAGEILDVDGETGGFNFQNAWTTGWIAGRAAAS